MCEPCCIFQVVSHLMHLGTVPYQWTNTASCLQKQGPSSWHAIPWATVLPSTWRGFRCGRTRWSGTPWNPQSCVHSLRQRQPSERMPCELTWLWLSGAIASWEIPLLCTQLIMVGTIPRAARCSSPRVYLNDRPITHISLSCDVILLLTLNSTNKLK